MGEYGWAIGVGIIILAVSLGRTLRAVGRAFGDRTTRAQPPAHSTDPELRADMDEMRHRLAELEERVDFTERLLAKRREGERLAPRGGGYPVSHHATVPSWPHLGHRARSALFVSKTPDVPRRGSFGSRTRDAHLGHTA